MRCYLEENSNQKFIFDDEVLKNHIFGVQLKISDRDRNAPRYHSRKEHPSCRFRPPKAEIQGEWIKNSGYMNKKQEQNSNASARVELLWEKNRRSTCLVKKIPKIS